jgi:hypothetical protein
LWNKDNMRLYRKWCRLNPSMISSRRLRQSVHLNDYSWISLNLPAVLATPSQLHHPPTTIYCHHVWLSSGYGLQYLKETCLLE